MAEGLEFHWLKAPLLRRGSSSAQGVGGRVRTPAPTAENGPGALAPKLRRRLGTAPGANFANPGPSGPGEIANRHSDFARRKFCLDLQVCVPRNGGPGADSPCQGEMSRSDRGGRVGEYEHGVLIWSRPRWRFAQSLVAPGEAQRSGSAGKRRSKGTTAVFAARRKRSGVDFATTSRHGQSRPPPAGGGIPCA